MADTVNMSVGTIVSIALGKPAAETAAGYSALTYTTIGEITEVPEHGPDHETATHTNVSTGVQETLIGSTINGTISIPVAKDWTDAGQAAVKAGATGANARATHSIKLVNATIGWTRYFYGKVKSDRLNPGDANTILGGSFEFALNSIPFDITTGVWDVTYTAGANGSIVGKTIQVVADGGSSEAVYAAPNATKTFVGWSDGSTDNPRTDLAVSADIAVTANFSA